MAPAADDAPPTVALRRGPSGPADASDPSPAPAAAAAAAVVEEVARGTSIGRYVVTGKLGEGGMGVVFAAYDDALHRRVAIKLVTAARDVQAQARLLAEARTMAQLSHVAIVPVYDVGTYTGAHGDQLFLAMELVDGMSLRSWQAASPRAAAELLAIYAQVGAALAFAHAAGVVHRDFKPDNVLVDGAGRPRVTDFGLAKVDPDARDDDHAPAKRITKHTITGSVAGTPGYMSPEQTAGEPTDARTDQFAFCAAVIEALTGKLPAADASAVVMPGVPTRAAAALRRGLAFDAAHRWPSMTELVAEIAPRRKTRGPLLAAGVAVVAVGALGAALLLGRGGASEASCDAGPTIAARWGDPQREQVTRALAATGVPGSDAFPEAVDRWTASWRALSERSCRATARGEQSTTLLDRRSVCLRQKLDVVAGVIAAATHADRAFAAHITSAEAQLPPLAICDDERTLLGEAPRPTDPAALAAIDRALAHLTDASTDAIVGHFAHEVDDARAALSEATASGYPPAVFSANALLGEAIVNLHADPAGAIGPLWAAISAQPGRTDWDAAAAYDELGTSLGDTGSPEPGLGLLQVAASISRAVPDHDEQLALIHLHTGLVLVHARHFAEAAAYLSAAAVEFGALALPQRRVLSLIQLAYLERAQDRLAESVPLLEEALAIAQADPARAQVIGVLDQVIPTYAALHQYDKAFAFARTQIAEIGTRPDHPAELVAAHLNVGVSLLRLRDLPGAETELRATVALATALLGPMSPELDKALVKLAEVEILRENDADARPLLARALAISHGANATLEQQEYPWEAETLWLAAHARRETGDLDGAMDAARRSVELVDAQQADTRDALKAYLELADTRDARHDRSGAREAMQHMRERIIHGDMLHADTVMLQLVDGWLGDHPK